MGVFIDAFSGLLPHQSEVEVLYIADKKSNWPEL